mmetsp:Transcript_26201/g.66555  ORF Transcript_26201/g.66555 Transcript_26201/m.66555 type:complete len:106 (+) Transcript_26201:147-464(+)
MGRGLRQIAPAQHGGPAIQIDASHHAPSAQCLASYATMPSAPPTLANVGAGSRLASCSMCSGMAPGSAQAALLLRRLPRSSSKLDAIVDQVLRVALIEPVHDRAC